MVRPPALASSVVLLRADLAWGQLLLFTSPGYSTTYKQAWAGWYNAGHVSAAEGGGLPMLAGHNGKRRAYDSAGLSAVRFGDSSGAFAEYDLIAPFFNKSL